MKHSRSLCLLLFIITFLTACDKDEEVNAITVNLTALELDGAGDKGTLVISSSALSWSVTSSVEWCTVSPKSGDTKIGTITINAEPNMTFAEREAIIIVSAPNAEDVHVTVKQRIPEGLNLLGLSKTEIMVEGGDTTINLILNSLTNSWSAATPVSWMMATPAEGSMGEYEIAIVINENTEICRIAYYTFKGNSTNDVVLKVTQKAPSYPSYSDPIAADMNGVKSDALILASKINLGWNLGNSLEATGGETSWGNPKTTKALIDSVKSAGFNAVRIPCAWNSYIENTATCKLKDSWLARVKEVVDYCIDNEMYVIINIHWDGGWLENNCTTDKQEENNAKQKALWEQIATYFRDYDEHLLFAGTNEPNVGNATEMSVLLSYEQTFIDAVRSTGGRNAYRVLIYQGPSTDIDKTNSLMKTLPSDVVSDRLMAEVHYYTPWNFCGLEADASWGKMFYYWGVNYHSTTDTDRNANWGEESTVDELFASMKSKFSDKGIPVILGEYGAIRRSNLTGDALTNHLASRAYYLKYVTRQAKMNGIIPFYWDNGGTGVNGFAIFNRNTKTIFDQQALDALKEGADEGEYPF